MNRSETNLRTCISSRMEKSRDEMIRFVLDPDNRVVADLKRKLPGRGVWVTAHRKDVQQAVDRRAVQR